MYMYNLIMAYTSCLSFVWYTQSMHTASSNGDFLCVCARLCAPHKGKLVILIVSEGGTLGDSVVPAWHDKAMKLTRMSVIILVHNLVSACILENLGVTLGRGYHLYRSVVAMYCCSCHSTTVHVNQILSIYMNMFIAR